MLKVWGVLVSVSSHFISIFFVQEFFARNKWNLFFKWRSQSPDINPIEHMWDELNRRTRHIRVRNADKKYQVLKREWEIMPMSVITTLLESMPRRLEAVIAAKG